MGRPHRQFVPGYPAHLVHRGNNRQAIFIGEEDYHFFWRCLKEASDEFEVAINAYVFMPNHVHLLATPASADAISKAMHSASRRYSGYFNQRYRRVGTIWQGRFYACVVTADDYLLACHRYIDLNPVRASLVDSPELYPWSSHRYYAFAEDNPLITPHPAIHGLASGDRSLSIAYRDLFRDPLDPSEVKAIRDACVAGRAVGGALRRAGRPRKNRA